MRSSVVIRRSGGFYYVFDDDAMIISYLTGYKVSGDRCGFPLNSLSKVTNLLEDNSINYIVKEKMEEIESKNFKKNNKYSKILDKGKKKFNIDYRINNIMEKLNELSYEELDELFGVIEVYTGER